MLSVRCLSVCLSVYLSCPVCDVGVLYCGQAAGWINMKLGTQVSLGPGHIVLHGDPPTPSSKGKNPQFSAYNCCGQMAGCIKMPLGREGGAGPSDIVLDGDPAPPPKGYQSPNFRLVYCGQTANGSRCHLVRR